MRLKKVLTIAGSDSGGGAGLQADLRTLTVLGVFGLCAVTAVTAQNTRGVLGVRAVDPEFLALQLDAVLGDLGADAAKTGMLYSAALIEVTGRKIRQYGLKKLVVDPVMVSKSGHRLLEPQAVACLIRELLPLALVVTPNLPEAEILTGLKIDSLPAMKRSAEVIREMGPAAVIVKGGHLDDGAPDVLCDGKLRVLPGERMASGPVHGTGCTFSAALAGYLAAGLELPEAAAAAKEFVRRSITAAQPLGRGDPPANQMFAAGANASP